ncbi:MAG: hypothetical protein H0W78_06180 [Planctomycetes bacterium]|nr:hypothetical protein [Planctomycetota bacterium]
MAQEVITTTTGLTGIQTLWVVGGAAGGILLIGIILFIRAYFRKVDQGFAMIVNTLRNEPLVTFTGALVIPIIHRVEIMDISLKTIEVDRQGTNGLICADNIRADIKVTFFVRVNKTAEDVLKVAGSVGVVRASDRRTLEELFQAKFSEALKTVGKKMNFIDLYNERDQFKEQIVRIIGRDLNGYSLEDAAIDFLEQTPLKLLDPDNILDSEGRKKIIDLTTQQRVKANEIQREGEKVIKKQDVEAREALLALERQQAEAEAKQHREIATNRAREQAEEAKVQFEEHKRAEEARLSAEQEIGILRENSQREVEVAGKNREGAVAVEMERIEKNRALEAISRERAVELTTIEKEKVLAVERKNIAEVIRERVMVEKKVAEEEERIKDVRATMEANRHKDVAITKATQEAEMSRIKEVKMAEASEQSAVHAAREKIVTADAEQTSAEKQAIASMRRAEGHQAEAAAEGLAQAKVKEADAVAVEKQGFAKARVMEAEAEAAKKRGLAEVEVKQASAQAIEQVGEAEASAIENRMLAEAKGLTEKATAMGKLHGETREHEEFRMRLEKHVEVEKVRIQGDVSMAEQRAHVLAESLKNAKFEIVGGDGAFFDRFVNAVGAGKAIDATVANSKVIQQLGREYLEEGRSLPDDLKGVLSSFGSNDLKNLSIAGVLQKLMAGKDPAKVSALLKQAATLGLIEPDDDKA